MFKGSRFYNLLRKWEKENKYKYISILKIVMNHYFDSLTGTCIDNSKLTIHNADCFYIIEIAYVLSKVGYSDYSIDYCSTTNDAIVTLRNSL